MAPKLNAGSLGANAFMFLVFVLLLARELISKYKNGSMYYYYYYFLLISISVFFLLKYTETEPRWIFLVGRGTMIKISAILTPVTKVTFFQERWIITNFILWK